MKTKEEIREFVLKTLLPYKEDNSLCGFERDGCVYLTNDGRKCAVGKWMEPGPWQKSTSDYLGLVQYFSPKEFFVEKAHSMNLTDIAWVLMQAYHDSIARYSADMCTSSINRALKALKGLEKELNIELPELYLKANV